MSLASSAIALVYFLFDRIELQAFLQAYCISFQWGLFIIKIYVLYLTTHIALARMFSRLKYFFIDHITLPIYSNLVKIFLNIPALSVDLFYSSFCRRIYHTAKTWFIPRASWALSSSKIYKLQSEWQEFFSVLDLVFLLFSLPSSFASLVSPP